MSEIGHNSEAGGIAGDRLKSIIERIERLETEKKDIQIDISEIKKEAKGAGFDVKVINIILQRRKRDAADLAEQDAIVELYMKALGMLADTPLGKSAMGRNT